MADQQNTPTPSSSSSKFNALKASLIQDLQNLNSPSDLDEASRYHIAEKLDRLRVEIEPPLQSIRTMAYGAMPITATRIAIEMGVFDALIAGADTAVGLSTDELDGRTKGEREFLVRILRILALKGIITRTNQDQWQANPISKLLGTGSPQASLIIHHYPYMKAYATMFDFIESTNFTNPNDYYNGPWQKAYTELTPKQGYFQWLETGDERVSQAFNKVMTIHQQFRGQNWFDFYPVHEKLIDNNISDDDTVLVDIGGGLGIDALSFCKNCPNIPGKVILQDLPHAINMVQGPHPPRFRAMVRDAFTAQPIKGAKAYYLRTMLHDWADTQALKILENTRDAMNQDSILLVNENVMPVDELNFIRVSLDFALMAFSALERTERQWVELIERAGFELVGVWWPTEPQIAPNALFEARLKRV